MKINVIRGQNQIGGSIIEISTNATKLIFDIGINLNENSDLEIPQIDGLFQGNAKYNAVFISHYHADHLGLIGNLVPNIPVYIGKNAYNILQSANAYLKKDNISLSHYLTDGEAIIIDDIKVTPLLCDHSAYDSYMFLIEGDNTTILYTGDFRANGRKDFSLLLNSLPIVDTLIIEGTTLSRENISNITEHELEYIGVKALKKHTGPAFVMMSAQNIDRLITMHNIATTTNRILAEDIYTAIIAKQANDEIPSPENFDNVKVFTTNNSDEDYKILSSFAKGKISRQSLSTQNYIMCVRPSMRAYLEKLNKLQSFENGILFYGMWKGYQENKYIQDFLKYMESKGVKIHTLHTSGHADAQTIGELIEKVKPKEIIPIHTENAQWFYDNYKNVKCVK